MPSTSILVGVANVMRFAGVDFRVAVEMATVHPAKLMKASYPKFQVGETAEYVLVERKMNAENVERLLVREIIC